MKTGVVQEQSRKAHQWADGVGTKEAEEDLANKTTREEIKREARQFILTEFLQGEDPAMLHDGTPLISGGILDSIGTVRLVTYLEKRFDIKISQQEVSLVYLDTLELVANTVESKIETRLATESE